MCQSLVEPSRQSSDEQVTHSVLHVRQSEIVRVDLAVVSVVEQPRKLEEYDALHGEEEAEEKVCLLSVRSQFSSEPVTGSILLRSSAR